MSHIDAQPSQPARQRPLAIVALYNHRLLCQHQAHVTGNEKLCTCIYATNIAQAGSIEDRINQALADTLGLLYTPELLHIFWYLDTYNLEISGNPQQTDVYVAMLQDPIGPKIAPHIDSEIGSIGSERALKTASEAPDASVYSATSHTMLKSEDDEAVFKEGFPEHIQLLARNELLDVVWEPTCRDLITMLGYNWDQLFEAQHF